MNVYKDGRLITAGTHLQSKHGDWYAFQGIDQEPTATAFGRIRVRRLQRHAPEIFAAHGPETFAESAFPIEFR